MKKYLLFFISATITFLILNYGSIAYQKEISQPPKTESIKNEVVKVQNQETNPENKVDKKTSKNKKTVSQPTPSNATKSTLEIQNTPTPIVDQINNPSPTPSPTIASSPINSIVETNNQFVTLDIQSLDNFKVPWQEKDTGWQIMKRAATKFGFAMSYQEFSFGIYVIKIGNLETHDNYYWALYYNNTYSMVGISDLTVQANDSISWQLEKW